MPPEALERLFGYGVLGIVFVLLLLGWLAPKWVREEDKKREAVKDAVIERLTVAIERLADRVEVPRK